jgi:tol-pal system protein YbgF
MHRATVASGLLALTGVLAGCLTVPPEEDPVYLKQVEIDNRLARVERIVDNQGLTNLTGQLEQLQKENEALRNEVETLRNSADQGGERQRQLYLDIDQRLQAIEQRAGPAARPEGNQAASGALAAVPVPVQGGGDKASYQAAFDLLKQGRYEQAAQAFRQFRTDYPASTLLDNAQYWLAESVYVTQKYKEALPEFELVLTKHPQSRKIPDALLKVGYCNYELKQYEAARKALSTVVQDYKETTAARLAGQRLQAMAAEGH